MNAPIYAVIDTNVIVSAMISDNFMAPTKRVIRSIFNDKIIPILSPEIYAEYQVILNCERKPVTCSHFMRNF